MPKVKSQIDVEIGFELWCSICGDGMCRNTNYKRGTENHFETHCSKCAKEAAEAADLIERLESQIERLEKLLWKEQHENIELHSLIQSMKGE